MHALARFPRPAYFQAMRPRRKQATITFQSDRAKARLALLTRDGRSQAQVIEEALDHAPLPPPRLSPEELAGRRARLEAILDRVDPSTIMTMAQFDAIEYDENGDLR